MKLSIGDFSRMTLLSVKALRHYHDVDLLEPASVDTETGYRTYESTQVATAQVIRRFRDLGMPIEQIKGILTATDPRERNNLIIAHLKRMESDLERTQAIVASLRTLLEASQASITVQYRSLPAVRVAAISKMVEFQNLGPWWRASYVEIERNMRQQGVAAAGPRGALFPTELFTDELADVTVYVPIVGSMSPAGNVVIRELPPVELAIAVHRGSYRDIDCTFGALGAHVVERTIAVDGPIREHYLVTEEDADDENRLVTEVGWPIFRIADLSS